MKILLVVTRPPFPPRRGDQMRALQTLELLGAAREVTLLAPEGGEPAPGPSHPISNPNSQVVRYRPPGNLERALGVLRAAFTFAPLQSGLFRSRDLAAKLRDLAPRHDLVILQLERLVGHLPDLGTTPMVVDLIDSLALNFERRARFDALPIRPALSFEARRLLAAERRLAARAERVLVVSERDRSYLAERLGPELGAKVEVVPLAMPAPEDLPPTLRILKRQGRESPFEIAPAEAPLLAITGNLGYFPTADGALWFLARVWPEIRAARPDSRLLLAGSRPSRRLREASTRAGVELVESPSDLKPLLEKATLALAPMRAGSGLPIKVLEAWSAGVPVIATPWTAAGVGGQPGFDLAVADPDPVAWRAKILELLDDPAQRRKLAENGRRRLVSDFSAEHVAALWRSALSARAAR